MPSRNGSLALVRHAAWVLALSLAATNVGCATIVAPGPDLVPVSSDPTGANIYLNGQLVGRTPQTIQLEREFNGELRIELQGHAPIVVLKSKRLNGWVFGNICLGGVIGLVVDAVSDNVRMFDTTPVHVRLVPIYANGQQGAPIQYQVPPNAPPPAAPPTQTPVPAPPTEGTPGAPVAPQATTQPAPVS